MIVATAGHVDHGKTSLVRALTGIDTDRLPEEKRRNLTIDLGFAYMPLADGGTLGFVDVPGHERFIRNMLCGVAAIDYALLVVAADDGVMPQTREHLAILDLLGVRQGAVAITKTDRVDAERVAEVGEEVALYLDETGLEGAPQFPVSAVEGGGVGALKAHLEAQAATIRRRSAGGHFRLAIDRAFTIVGTGLVITGTAFSGSVAVGDRLLLSPRGAPVRVRRIHAQNRAAEAGRAGERLALNIVGQSVGKDDVARGDWLVAEAAHIPVQRIDATVRILADETRPTAHWTPVHVHLGAVDVTGRLALLETASLAPGSSGLAQLVLSQPVGAMHGDRFVLRDQSTTRTIGGGTTIDILPPPRGRARPARLAYLRAAMRPDPGAALQAAVDAAGETDMNAVDLGRFARARNLTEAAREEIYAATDMVRLGDGDRDFAFSKLRWTRLKADVEAALSRWHESNRDSVGPTEANLRSTMEPRIAVDLLKLAIPQLERDGVLRREGARVRLPGHRPRMTDADEALWKRLEPLLEDGGTRPPLVSEIAERTGMDTRRIANFLSRAARLGLVVGAAKNRYYLPAALRSLAESLEAAAGASAGGAVTAASFRDRAGIGRNLAIEILEYFDRVRFTRRVGNERRILRPAAEVFGAGGARKDGR